MTDEPENLVLALLRKLDAKIDNVEATQAQHTAEFASIKETLRLHGGRLDNHTAMFEDIGDKMREIRGLLKDYAIAQELRRTMRDLVKRVSALEGR